MAKKSKKKEPEAGTLGRLSKAGEEALTRLVEELGKNERVTDAVGRAMSAKGKLDDASKRALGQVGVAAAEELKDLRKHIERLEKRLAKLEADTKPATRPRTTTRARKTTAKATTKAESPPAGPTEGSGSGGPEPS